MTKAKRIEKKAAKAAQVEEVKAPYLPGDELMAKAREDFAKKYPSPEVVLAKTVPAKTKVINEPEEVVEEIIDDLERGEEEEIEIIEVAPVKGKKVISQNSEQAQKLLAKKDNFIKDHILVVTPTPDTPAKKKLADMTEKERKEYYINLSAKASAAKRAKAEAKLAAEGNTDFPEKEPENNSKSKSKRTSAPTPVANPLSGRVIPGNMTGRNLKTILKAEKKAESKAKKSNKPTIETTSKRTTTPLSKMNIEELNGIKGTIADVQWNKYFKMAGGVAGDAIKKVAKPVIVKEVEPVVDPPDVAKKVVRTAAPAKPEVKVKVLSLSDFTLDELIEELKARGCKGTIKICAEVEL